MIKKNVKLGFMLAIVGLLGFTSQAFSQHYCSYDNWSRSAGMQWWNNNIPTEYSLSADQISKINDIRTNSNKKVLPLQNELQVLRMESHGYNANSEADIKKIQSSRNKIRELEEKISDINLDTRLKVNKMLSKEQLVYFNDGGYGWWDMADNCWYSHDNMMRHGEYSMRKQNHHRCCR
jgi:hypothetical protein